MSQVTTDGLSYLDIVEEHFQVARGTLSFRLSPLDWALVEAWQQAGIPLDAVLRGIDQTFENWRKRPRGRTEKVNSIAYCAPAIAAEAHTMAETALVARRNAKPPFEVADVCAFVARNAATLIEAGHAEIADMLAALDVAALFGDLERLEERLCAIGEKMIARLRAQASEDALLEARRTLDLDLKPYRGRMTADQIAMLEKQFLERRLLEAARLSRLSLFYL
jgi:hypothetical protein